MTQKKSKSYWFRQWIFFTLFMYVFMVILFPLLTKDEITIRSILIGIPVWAFASFISVYLSKKYPYVSKWQKKSEE